MNTEIHRIFLSATVVLVLFVMLILIEPPVSPLAWILSAAIGLSLGFIVVSSFKNRKKISNE